MRDLRPYICTARECDHATKSFPSLNRYLTHEIEAHELYPSERSSDRIIKSKKQESIVCIFCGERTQAGKGDNARGRHVGGHMEEIAFTVVPKAYEEWEFYSESSSANSHPYVQSKTAGVNQKSSTTGANQNSVGEVSMPSRVATAKDAKKHNIPTGYSLKRWDPEEEPLLLLGSVFDANSLGKWIYDWTAFYHGATTPMCDLAGELWLLMIQLAGKQKRIEGTLSRLTNSEDKELLDDFCLSAERLWGKFKKLLKACEENMWPVEKDRAPNMSNTDDGDLGTRSRLTQEQLATLEAEFTERYKPNTKYKKNLAEKMGVEFQKVNVSDCPACVIFGIDLDGRTGFRIVELKQNIRIHKGGDVMFRQSSSLRRCSAAIEN